MAGEIDLSRLRDPALRPIGKVGAGERLDAAEGVTLYATRDLLGLGLLADSANRRRNGDRVFFSANQHINPTNVCVLRNTCVFCSFARMPKEDGAYTRSLEEVYAEAEQARGTPTREFHIVGGLDPKLRLELLHRHDPRAQGAPSRRPHQGAHRGRDRAPRADREDVRARGAASRCKEAGLDQPARRRRRGVQHRGARHDRRAEAHRRGVDRGAPRRRTSWASARNCTMLYGHVETAQDRIEHLAHAARAAGRDRRLPHLHPAGLSPRSQRAGRGARPGGHRHDRLRGPEATSPWAGCSSTTSRTSRRTGPW